MNINERSVMQGVIDENRSLKTNIEVLKREHQLKEAELVAQRIVLMELIERALKK